MIAAERRHMADLFAGLTSQQLARQSLCDAWTPGFAVGTRLRGLCFETTDTGWATGAGAVVRGPAEAIVLAMSGRTAAWAGLTGDGAELLRDRISQETVIPVRHRLKAMAVTVLRPPDRRSRDVGPPDLVSRQPPP